MSKLIGILSDLNLWAGAVLGAFVSAAFATALAFIHAYIQRLPRRKLLGSLGRDSQLCEISMRLLFNEDGKFLSMPVDGYVEQIQNTQYAYGVGDVEAAMRVINLLGQVRHSTGIRVVAVREAAKIEDLPGITIGGTPRAAEVLELAPELVTSFTNEQVFSGSQEFKTNSFVDYAVIFRVSGNYVGHPHFAVFGLHWIGTRAAGIFLEKNAVTLGDIFGKKSFVVVLRTPRETDTSQVVIVHYDPKPSLDVRLFHPLAYRRFMKLLAHS